MPPRQNRYQRRTNIPIRRQLKNLDRRIDKIEDEDEVKYVQTPQLLTANVNPEGSGSQPPNANPSLLLLNPVAQGVGYNNRIGDQITATGLWFKGIFVNQSLRTTYSYGRLIIFWFKVPIITAIAASQPDLVGDSNSGQVSILNNNSITTSPQANMPYSMENHELYDIVYDKTIIINPQTVSVTAAGATTSLTQNAVHIKKKFKFGRKVNFSDGGATAHTSNTLWAAFIAGNADTTMLFDAVYRFTYKDS